MNAPEADRTGPIVATLRDWAEHRVSPEIATMRLILLAPSGAEPRRFLFDALDAADLLEPERDRLSALADTACADEKAWARVRRIADAVPHGEPARSPKTAVERFAARFDAAARISPEASVALYSLGDPARLDAATAEIVAWLDAKRLIGPDARVLDLGCGIGRVAVALAPLVRSVLGCDVSAEMIRIAEARAAGLGDVAFRLTSGLDLAGLSDAAFDLALGVDVFPYLVEADLAAGHVWEAARVLAPGGRLAILNLSYRGDAQRDASDLAAWARAAGLGIVESGARPFRIWDATAFLLRKEPAT